MFGNKIRKTRCLDDNADFGLHCMCVYCFNSLYQQLDLRTLSGPTARFEVTDCEFGLEINAVKTKYICMSLNLNAVQNNNINTTNHSKIWHS